MEGIKWKKVFISAALTMVLSYGVYYVFSIGTPVDSVLSNLIVSASDNIAYTEDNFISTATNEKAGLTFNYYYDKSTEIYGIKAIVDYPYTAPEIREYYSQNDVFLIESDDLKFIYLVVYDDSSDEYVVEDIFNIENDKVNIDVNKRYNNLLIKNIYKNEGLGWVANCESGSTTIVKKAIMDSFEYPDYIVSESNTGLKIKGIFSSETHQYEFTVDENTSKTKPMTKWDAEQGQKKYDVVFFDMQSISSAVVAKFNEESEQWEITKGNDIPLLDSEKEVYETDEVAYVAAFDLYLNRVKLDECGKLQCFDKDGNFQSYYIYDLNPNMN